MYFGVRCIAGVKVSKNLENFWQAFIHATPTPPKKALSQFWQYFRAYQSPGTQATSAPQPTQDRETHATQGIQPITKNYHKKHLTR